MIKGFDKLIQKEFKFPIMNAAEAVYKIKSVNEVKDEGNTKWFGVLGCKYAPDPNLPYQNIPDYIVFTLEYDGNNQFKISGMITNEGTQTIYAKVNEMNTMEGFLLSLKRIAVLFDKTK